MKEIWKDINGYEGKYQVSNLGNIKSLNYAGKGFAKLLTPKITKTGYATIGLSRGRQDHKMFSIHRLVAEAFIPNPNNLPVVNHKDENKLNNCITNLEWCTIGYNNMYGSHPIIVAEYHKKKVKCIETNIIYDSVSDAANSVNVSISGITYCCKGRYKTSGGYHWSYLDEINK